MRRDRRRAFALLGVLVVVTLLSLSAYRFSDLMFGEMRAGYNVQRATEARSLADSGVHYTAAMLADPENLTGLGNNPLSNPEAFREVALGESGGRFSIVTLNEDPAGFGQAYRFGVTDESGKLNVNGLIKADGTGDVLYNALLALPDMTEDVAAAIVDWVDGDGEPRDGGAENDYYSGLNPPYNCKDGNLDSLDELLLVRGVTPELLYGNDLDRDGEPDDPTPYNPGLARFLTVYSRESNVAPDGTPRVNINQQDLTALQAELQPLLGDEMTTFILAYRIYGGSSDADRPATSSIDDLQGLIAPRLAGGGRQQIKSLYDLIDARVTVSGGRGRPERVFASPLSGDVQQQRQVLPALLDSVTTEAKAELPARVNVNTCSEDILRGVAQIAQRPDLADQVLAARPDFRSGGAVEDIYNSTAWLLTEAGVEPEALKALEKYITARPQVYRFQAVGYFDRSAQFSRIEAVIDTNAGNPRVVFFRDLSELGIGFEDLRGR